MEQLDPLRMLVGNWKGQGTGKFGPFEVAAEFEERGRWILLRHAIFPAGDTQPFYVSTQVYGFDDRGLRLDYFDTAGSFRFQGSRDGDHLSFSWRNAKQWKESEYWAESNGAVRFSYRSMDSDGGDEPELTEFEGTLTRT